MPFCAHCGTKLDPGTKFCGECGQSVSEAGRPTSPPVESPLEAPPKKRKKSKLFWFFLVMSVPLIILGVLISWYGSEYIDRRVEQKGVTKEKATQEKSKPPMATPPKKETPILDGRKEKGVTKEKTVEKKSKPPVTTAPKEQTPVLGGGQRKAIEQKIEPPVLTTPNKRNPILDAPVVVVRFFESGYGLLPRNERIYKNDFGTSQTRFVNWELSFEHPPLGSQIDYEIEAVWLRGDGSVYTREKTLGRLEPSWTFSEHVSGWGSHNVGTWPIGTYKTEFYVEGEKIAEASFRIR